MSKLLESYNIKLFSTFSTRKASIVERWNRTIKERMFREFSAQGSYKWLKLLPKIVSDYNNSYHRTIKMAPNAVTPKDEAYLKQIYYLNEKKRKKEK